MSKFTLTQNNRRAVYRAPSEQFYTDNLMVQSHMDIDDVKRMIYITEKGLKQGNTYLKEWAISGQSGMRLHLGRMTQEHLVRTGIPKECFDNQIESNFRRQKKKPQG